jgi:hypothetical protein
MNGEKGRVGGAGETMLIGAEIARAMRMGSCFSLSFLFFRGRLRTLVSVRAWREGRNCKSGISARWLEIADDHLNVNVAWEIDAAPNPAQAE